MRMGKYMNVFRRGCCVIHRNSSECNTLFWHLGALQKAGTNTLLFLLLAFQEELTKEIVATQHWSFITKTNVFEAPNLLVPFSHLLMKANECIFFGLSWRMLQNSISSACKLIAAAPQA